MELKPASHSRTMLLTWLIASQFLALLSLIFWLFAVGLFAMASDPGVAQGAQSVVIGLWAYPLWPIVFAIAAWIAYARKRDKLASVLTTLTFLPVLILILAVLLSGFVRPVGL